MKIFTFTKEQMDSDEIRKQINIGAMILVAKCIACFKAEKPKQDIFWGGKTAKGNKDTLRSLLEESFPDFTRESEEFGGNWNTLVTSTITALEKAGVIEKYKPTVNGKEKRYFMIKIANEEKIMSVADNAIPIFELENAEANELAFGLLDEAGMLYNHDVGGLLD